MNKFVVLTFPDETKASAGTRALRELHREGSLTLYGMAVVAKDANGSLAVRERATMGPIGTLVGALVGGSFGLLGGPVGAAIGVTGGTLLGGWRDVYNLGVSETFLDEVSQRLTPGKAAVVAEVDEDWVTPLDRRMETIGGSVVREWRLDFEDELDQREVVTRSAEVAQLKAECAQAGEETRAKLKAQVDDSQMRLQEASKRAQAWIARRGQETDAKIHALQDQAATANADRKAKLDQRITELRADYERRSAKLKQALELTKEALAP
jgi:uncharacterized membrane protein